MLQDRLTNTGVEKILNGIPQVMLQVLNVIRKTRGQTTYLLCDLSDGFAKIRNCVILDEETISGKKVIGDLVVIEVSQFVVEPPKKNSTTPVVIIQKLKIINGKIKTLVGSPMDYEEYVKSGKNNPDGDNFLPQIQVQSKPQDKMPPKANVQPKLESKPVPPQKQKLNEETRAESSDHLEEQSYTASLNGRRATPTLKPPVKIEPKGKVYPVAKVDQTSNSRGQSNPTKIAIGKPNSAYNPIKGLYLGMENWIILCRVLFVSPLKQIITKKGTESSLLSVQVGDSSGTIECTIFGQTAVKFENIFREDEVFEISQGYIGQSTYMGKKQLKISLNEQTVVNLKKDDTKTPFSQDFCLTIQNVTELGVGEECRVICLIKDSHEVNDFVSKAGKKMRKKIIYLCDPEAQVEIEVSLLNEKTDIRFQNCPYMVKGLVVSEYNGNKQYNLKSNSVYRQLRHHPLRKYLKDLESIVFINANSNQKRNRKASINNFLDLNTASDPTNSGLWSQVVCYLSSIRTGKNCYLGCPHCRKKVSLEHDGVCALCSKSYEKAKYRYTLSVGLCDSFDSIWATVYDAEAEQILGLNGENLPAEKFVELNEDQVKERVNMLKMKELKLRMVTKSEEYGGQARKKTNVLSILPLSYAEESRLLVERIKEQRGL